MARRFAPRSRGGVRRKTDWFASAPLTAPVAVAASSAVLLEVAVPFDVGETVIRIRGLVSVRSDQVVASENMLGAFGIGIVTEQAATAGIASIPHPVTDGGWDGWMWHTYFADRFTFLDSSGFSDGVSPRHYVIDSKAMRKVDGNERLVVVVENSTATGINVTSMERILSKVN